MSTDARLSPKTRRTVLEQLSRERLAELAERFALDVADRRSIDAHIDAIVRKRSLDFEKLLDALQRDELKAACEALGLEATLFARRDCRELATFANQLGDAVDEMCRGRTGAEPDDPALGNETECSASSGFLGVVRHGARVAGVRRARNRASAQR